MNKIKVIYIDEEYSWQSIAYHQFKNIFDLSIPEVLPRDIKDIWPIIRDSEAQIALVDYRLHESGIISYTGDDVTQEVHRHNKHFPVVMLTSFEDNALIECKEAKIIRQKELLVQPELQTKLKNIIIGSVNNYINRKYQAENVIKLLQDKLKREEQLTDNEKADKFEVELYLSELDLDNSVRTDLIMNKSNETLDNILTVAREIIKMHKK